jgi:TPR repeat protein
MGVLNMRDIPKGRTMSCAIRHWLRFSIAVLFLSCLAGRTPPCLAAPSTQNAAAVSQPATAATAPAASQDATQAGGQQTISHEALFAAMLVNAEKGQPQAMLTVGALYEQGIGVPRNFTKAFEWYAKAANAGEPDAWMRLGVCHEVGIGTTADTLPSCRPACWPL